MFPLAGILIVLKAFPNTELLSDSGPYRQVVILFVLFGAALSSFCYLFSFMFKTPSGAQNIMLFLIFITGLLFGVLGIVLRLLESTGLYFRLIRYLLLLFPPFALIEGLHNLCLIR